MCIQALVTRRRLQYTPTPAVSHIRAQNGGNPPRIAAALCSMLLGVAAIIAWRLTILDHVL